MTGQIPLRIVVALALGGCVAELASCHAQECAGPGIESPYVAVQPQPWLSVHPGDTLMACVQRSCVTLDQRGVNVDGTHLNLASAATRQDVTVTVAGYDQAGHPLLHTSTGAHVRRHLLVRGPCGPVFESWARLTVSAQGRLLSS